MKLDHICVAAHTVKLRYNVLLGTGKISTLYLRYVVTKKNMFVLQLIIQIHVFQMDLSTRLIILLVYSHFISISH